MIINLLANYDFRERELGKRYIIPNKFYSDYDVSAAIVDAIWAQRNVFTNDENNPDSLQNLNLYSEKLKKLYWAWPYDMSSKEMANILDHCADEKDFDKALLKWFSNTKIEYMFYEIEAMISRHHKTILRQAYRAFVNHDYAIVNNALLSIIDNTLSKYLKSKKETKRYAMLQPIVRYYADMPKRDTYSFLFDLVMLANNVDFVFETIYFDSVTINTNKKVRRHTALHGVKYSNKRIDSIMLFNLLFVLLKLEHRLVSFERGVEYNRDKGPRIADGVLCVKTDDMVETFILSIIRMDKKISHKELVECLNKSYFVGYYSEKTGVLVSKILQKLKRQNIIENRIIDNRIYWCLKKD